MSDRLNPQSAADNSATAAPTSNTQAADSPINPNSATPLNNLTPSAADNSAPPPPNTAITAATRTTPEPLSHNVSHCPTIPSFVLIQSPKPKNPPNPEDLPQYEPAQPPPDGQSLTPLQQQAIHLLLQGLSDSAVARRIGVNRKTIHRWKWYTPLFYNTLDEAQRQAWNEAYGLLRSSILKSAQTLNHVLKKGSPQHALQATRILLSNSVLTRLEG